MNWRFQNDCEDIICQAVRYFSLPFVVVGLSRVVITAMRSFSEKKNLLWLPLSAPVPSYTQSWRLFWSLRLVRVFFRRAVYISMFSLVLLSFLGLRFIPHLMIKKGNASVFYPLTLFPPLIESFFSFICFILHHISVACMVLRFIR